MSKISYKKGVGVPPEWVIPNDGTDDSSTKAMISACLQGSVDSFKQLYDSSEPHQIPPPSYLVRLATKSRCLPMLNHILKLYPLRRLLSFKTKMDTTSYDERLSHISYSVLLAISQGDLAIVQRFLKAGMPMEPYIEDEYNRVDSLLEQAITEDQTEIARLLLVKRADPNFGVLFGSAKTCLSLAAAYGRHAILNLLLEYGGRIEDSDAMWYTATTCDTVECAQTLLDWGADINEIFISHFGRDDIHIKGTALHAAAGSRNLGPTGNTVMTKWLLEHGIDHTIKNGCGQTALQLAQERGDVRIVSLIESWLQNQTV